MISSSCPIGVSMLSYLFGGKSFWFESWDFMWNLVKSCYFSLRLWFCNCLQLSWFYFHKNGGEFVKSWDISAGYHNISHQICSFCEKLRNLEIFWEWLVNWCTCRRGAFLLVSFFGEFCSGTWKRKANTWCNSLQQLICSFYLTITERNTKENTKGGRKHLGWHDTTHACTHGNRPRR